MEHKAIIFIYSKGKEIKVLNINDSKRFNDKLIKDGWTHTQTLDACKWVEYLFNDCDNITEEIKSLSGGYPLWSN